jgi:hypothetical protein
MTLTYSPTKWGRVSVSLEPSDARTWLVKFRREDFDAQMNTKLTNIIMPRHLPGNFQFDKWTGAPKAIKNGPEVWLDSTVLEWQATFHNFERNPQ